MKKYLIIFLFLISCMQIKGNMGIVKIEGIIIDYEDKVKEIEYFEKIPFIKGIVVYINSPGGSASSSYQIYSRLKKFKEKTKKKVYAYIETVGASGGYYVACASDKIFSDPNSLTGSIGVRVTFIYYYDLLKKIGIYEKTIKSGKYKDIGSPFREMTKEEEKIIEEFINDIYEDFLKIVSESRNLPLEKLKEYADGRIFSGKKAKEIGLVDDVMSFEEFKEILKRDFSLKEIIFVKAPIKKKFLKRIFEFKNKIFYPEIKVEYRFP